MRAERRKCASTSSASGSTALGKIGQYLLLGHSRRLALRSNPISKLGEKFALEVNREIGLVPRYIESRRFAVARNEDYLLGAEHLACVMKKISDRNNLHCGHLSDRFSKIDLVLVVREWLHLNVRTLADLPWNGFAVGETECCANFPLVNFRPNNPTLPRPRHIECQPCQTGAKRHVWQMHNDERRSLPYERGAFAPKVQAHMCCG